MSAPAKKFFEFGPYRIDPLKRRLLRGGEVVPLTPKAFDTLLVLVESGGQVIEKDDLMDKVWPGVAVEENNLTQNISALRKALGEKRDEPKYILTVSGLGYRFIASVTEHSDDGLSAAAALSTERQPTMVREEPRAITDAEPPVQSVASSATTWKPRSPTILASVLVAMLIVVGAYYLISYRAKSVRAGASPNSQIRSIAILPFRALVAGDTDEYFGLGMADALITKLSSIRQITVRPTSSIVSYANSETDPLKAGRELEVDSVLNGRVQRSGDRVRVTVQLVRASDGAPLWAGKFDEKETDVFTLEDRISEEVAASLLPTLTGAEKERLTRHYTEDTEAYQSYVKGRYYWNKRDADGLKKAIGYFEDAIIKDPNYALAYAGLADSYATLGVVEELSSLDVMPKARSAALRALELDDGLAEAHASLGYVKHRFEWDWPGAEKEFKRALELNADYAAAHQWYGWYLISETRFEEAQLEFKRAEQIDPLSLYTNLTAGMPYFYSGQHDKAAAQYKKVIEMDTSFWLAHRWLGKTYEQQGKYDEAIAEFQTVVKLHGGNMAQAPALGCVYALAGKQTEARRVLAELLSIAKQRYVSPYSVAMIYATLGDKDQAFEWLAKDLKERGNELVFLRVEQRFKALRSDPRFDDLVKEVGIPQ